MLDIKARHEKDSALLGLQLSISSAVTADGRLIHPDTSCICSDRVRIVKGP